VDFSLRAECYHRRMIRATEVRPVEHGVDALFVNRWSPRGMSGESISNDELLRLFEAARWAPSAGNLQPWRMLYAHRDTPDWPLFFDILNPRNQLWCVNAAVLVVFISKTMNPESGREIKTHSYDTGAAWASFALQGTISGLVVHGMQGFNYERAREVLEVPPEFAVEAMAAVGRPGSTAHLPEDLQARERPSNRRPLSETVFEGRFRA
jgi:nitroreductase